MQNLIQAQLFKCQWATPISLSHSNATEPEPLCDDQVLSGGVAALPDDPGSPPSTVLPALPPPKWATLFVLVLIQVFHAATN